MAQDRAVLCTDALILSNRPVAGQIGITAAVDMDDVLAASESAVTDTPLGARQLASAKAPTNELQLKALENELQRLRGILEKELGRRTWQDAGSTTTHHSALRQRLLRLGLSRTLAGSLLDRIPQYPRLERAWDDTLLALADQLRADSIDNVPGELTAVYGATGVGKTSTLARLAARNIQRFGPEMVGLITLDSYRIGAHEQLANFADTLSIPLLTADDSHSLSAAVRKMQGRRVFVDTAGMNQHDRRLLGQYELVNSVRQPVRHVLVLSASAQASQCRALAANFARHKLSGAIISKVDEAQSLGGVIDVAINAKLPLLGFSDGQRVPEDLHDANSLELVHRAALLSDSDRSSSFPRHQLRAAG